ncbi:MAG: hypothetical protein QOK40_414 [Miltoncostaeaceae bacterium]|jgi:hypothetical protein|nr:hypothetical protein [Miltoncostaeaceae bacterium]
MNAEVPGRSRVALLAAAVAAFGSLPAPPASAAVEPAWLEADRVLAMPVLRPAAAGSLGLRLKRVLPGRGCLGEQLDAVYNGPGGRFLRIGEGRPGYCGDLGDVPLLGRPLIGLVRGRLYAYGEGPRRDELPFTAAFSRRGVEVTMISSRLGREPLLRLARSMRVVG